MLRRSFLALPALPLLAKLLAPEPDNSLKAVAGGEPEWTAVAMFAYRDGRLLQVGPTRVWLNGKLQ